MVNIKWNNSKGFDFIYHWKNRTDGGTGYSIEFGGTAIRSLSMEGRMTVCNMTIEAGARAGLIGVDNKTLNYLKERHYTPSGRNLEKALEYWKTLHSDKNASFDKVININANEVLPMVSWGTSPEMVTDIDGVVPERQKLLMHLL